MGQNNEWPRREPPLRGDGSNRHTPDELYAWLSAPGHFYAVMAAVHDGENAAGLRIPAPGVVCQALWHKLWLLEVKT